MRDSGAAVHNDPFAVFLAFDAWLGKTGLTNGIAHAGGQRLGLAVGGSRGHDDALEQRGDVLRVKHLDVLGFYIFQPVNDGALQFLDIFFALVTGGFDNGGGHAVLCF